MTLGELAQLVGDKVNMTDQKTLKLIKRYAERRHSMLCRMGLWRELLNLYSITAKAGVPEVTLPPQVSTLVAVRSDDNNLLPVDTTYTFMTDPELWQRVGTPTMFVQLPSVATRLAPLSQALSIESTNALDVSEAVFVKGERAGDPCFDEITLTGLTPVGTNAHYDVVYSITKSVGVLGEVIIKRAGDYQQIGELLPSELVRHYRRIRLLETPKEDLALDGLRRARPTARSLRPWRRLRMAAPDGGR